MPTWSPSVADVAAIIRARTQQDDAAGGGEAETFNENTRPTATQVTALISLATGHVSAIMGREELCESASDLASMAKNVAAMRTALLIEQSYWPEQTKSDRSSFERLKSLYDDDVKILAESVSERCGGPTSGGGDDGTEKVLNPSYGFPDVNLLGWSSSW